MTSIKTIYDMNLEELKNEEAWVLSRLKAIRDLIKKKNEGNQQENDDE